jgi:hypothetical protein
LLDFLGSEEVSIGKDEARMLRLFVQVADSGPPRNDEISHILDRKRGIWEFIRRALRVPYFYDEGRVVICSHGFAKSSKKTPKEELARAQRCFDQYQTAKAQNALEIEEET